LNCCNCNCNCKEKTKRWPSPQNLPLFISPTSNMQQKNNSEKKKKFFFFFQNKKKHHTTKVTHTQAHILCFHIIIFTIFTIIIFIIFIITIFIFDLCRRPYQHASSRTLLDLIAPPMLQLYHSPFLTSSILSLDSSCSILCSPLHHHHHHMDSCFQ